jgi:hypothetical protein
MSICSCCCISSRDLLRCVVLMVPVSSRPQQCDFTLTSESFPFTRYLVALCSSALRTVMCVVVFKCPGWQIVVQDPSLCTKLICLLDSPRFLNIEERCRLLLPRKELASACLGPHVSNQVTVFPIPPSTWYTPPLIESKGALLATICHLLHACPQSPPHVEGKP